MEPEEFREEVVEACLDELSEHHEYNLEPGITADEELAAGVAAAAIMFAVHMGFDLEQAATHIQKILAAVKQRQKETYN